MVTSFLDQAENTHVPLLSDLFLHTCYSEAGIRLVEDTWMTQSPDPDALGLGRGWTPAHIDPGREQMGMDLRPALTATVSRWGWTPAPC